MKVAIVAGEASGDILGAGLLTQLKKSSDITATGVGGDKMCAAGFNSLFDINRLNIMGLIEPLFHLKDLLYIRRTLLNHFLQNKPDVFVGIDYPDFNLSLELLLKKQTKIPIVHYVSPSVWAWRQKRIIKIAKAVDLMLTLFPFEADFYQKHGVPVCYVGHPLADMVPLQPDKSVARLQLNLDPEKIYIALLPGSRRNEIKYLADVFIRAAWLVYQKKQNVEFITSAINKEREQEFKNRCQQLAPNLPIHFFTKQSHEVLAASDAVLVTSGTATLETLLFKRPMVVAYRMSAIGFQIAKRLIKLPYISLPNLLAKEPLVPEFIQSNANPENLAHALIDYLNHPEKTERLKNKFLEIHQTLRCNANEKVVEAIRQLIN